MITYSCFGTPFIWIWFGLIAITSTIYIILYDWWLDLGQSCSQAVILRRWILGGGGGDSHSLMRRNTGLSSNGEGFVGTGFGPRMFRRPNFLCYKTL
ncbi:hypothetical protein Hanom_Chr09g00783121 [Helianthus anomalus]